MNDLIAACKNNNRVAQEQLYEKYKTQVYRTALLISHNCALADDITQESFIRVFEKIHLYDEAYSFDAWLYKVVVNTARNILRTYKWVRLFKPLDDNITESLTAECSAVEKSEQKLVMAKLVEGMPFKQKEVIILKYYNSFSQEEIASILQIPVGTVKSRINSGLETLRKKISNDKSLGEVLSYE